MFSETLSDGNSVQMLKFLVVVRNHTLVLDS